MSLSYCDTPDHLKSKIYYRAPRNNQNYKLDKLYQTRHTFRPQKIRLPYVKATEYKTQLQKEINKLARQIDLHFNHNCICCNLPLKKQVHGAHFHNVSGNENIRYNLHNIHASTSQCNKYSSEHKVGYRNGLEKRYSRTYLDYVDTELGRQYKYIGLNELEVVEALKIVRKLNREFNTFKLKDSLQARNMFNKIIGIYGT